MKLARRLVMRRSMQNIADLVKDSVANNPLEKLQAIATRLDVDRHTLARALRRYQGISFRELQRLALQQRVHVLMSQATPPSKKQVADPSRVLWKLKMA
jgi:methylphosphotriester-DNA--protein-cysteine methyltransferase